MELEREGGGKDVANGFQERRDRVKPSWCRNEQV